MVRVVAQNIKATVLNSLRHHSGAQIQLSAAAPTQNTAWHYSQVFHQPKTHAHVPQRWHIIKEISAGQVQGEEQASLQQGPGVDLGALTNWYG